MAGPKPNPTYDRRMGIYRITHVESGREYIGSAVDFHARLSQHLSKLRNNKHHSKYLQRIYNKHGVESLEFDVLEIIELPDNLDVEVVKALLLEHEQVWLDDRKPVMNSTPTAGSTLGFKHSDETKTLISQILRERPLASAETRAKLSAAKSGHEVSGETRELLRQANVGKKHTEESKEKMRGPRGPLSDERKQAMSDRMKGTNPIGLTRNKPGHEVTPETLEKMRQANLGKKASDATRQKMSKSQTGRRHSEETKAKMRASRLAYIESERLASLEGMNGDSHPDGEATEATG